MNKWLYAYVTLVALVFAVIVVQCTLHLSASEWAGWAQAIGSAGAVIGAVLIARYEIRSERDESAHKKRVAEARELLAIQQMAAELGQMCTLSNFEKSNDAEGTIYPDAPAEFRAIAEMFGKFQAVSVTALGEMERLLYMRRIATGAAMIFERDRDVKGDVFTVKHRTVFTEYTKDCLRFAQDLAERVEELAPGEFSDRIRNHL